LPSKTGCDLSVAVLGAGLAGLAAAQRLHELACHVDVYERNSYAGGRAYSHQVDGFVFDEGPHVSFTKRPEIESLFAKALNGNFVEQEAILLSYWQAHLVRHPAQSNLYGLPVDVVERCILDFVKAQYGSDHADVRTYADWCCQQLGRTFSQEFTFRYTRKYWASEAKDMSADWVGDRMYSPKLGEILRGALSPNNENHHYITRFRYPCQGGFGAYVQAVASDLNVHLGHEVTMVDLKRRLLEFANGKKAHFEVLVSSLPLPELIRCIKDVPKRVSEATQRLTCTSLVLVNVGIERDCGFPNVHWMYFYDEDIIFARGNLPHRLSANNVPPGCGSIQVEVYGSKYRPMPCQDILNRSIEDMIRVGLLHREDHIRVAHELHIPYANILFDLSRATNLAQVQSYLSEQGIISCGRYGQWEYYWSDDSIVSGWRAGHKVSSSLEPYITPNPIE
jgi:protoporphyrinogen oxidase